VKKKKRTSSNAALPGGSLSGRPLMRRQEDTDLEEAGEDDLEVLKEKTSSKPRAGAWDLCKGR